MATRPTVVILRGLLRRCPRCGEKLRFQSWWKVPKRCPRCGLVLERDENSFLGSLTINYAVTGAAFIALLVIWLIVDLPDVQVVPLLLTGVFVTMFVPLVLYPFAKTTWAAFDLLTRPVAERDWAGDETDV